jgi:hypothetical protein
MLSEAPVERVTAEAYGFLVDTEGGIWSLSV